MRHQTFLAATLGLILLAGSVQAQHEGHQLGEIDFPVSCNQEAQEQLEIGLAQLHHMMYEQARSFFEAAAEADPQCAMAHWGIAMSSFQPLWHPTSDEGLERGKDAVEKARSIGTPTEREEAYIAAAETFFTDPDPPIADRPKDHEARVRAWMEAQRQVHERYPDDPDAAALYALTQVSYATTQFSPVEEQDYARQRQAGALLEEYLEDHPEHPGLYHYTIHAYDSPALASEAERVAQQYDKLAPDTPHALHMPSHIFVRRGEWEQTAEWNERSAEAALRHSGDGPLLIHYPHALDYLMYAYLQQGEDAKSREVLEKVREIEDVQPTLASAYGIAASQARFYLEKRKWEEAAELEPRSPGALSWEEYPAADAIFHYARGLGAARSDKLSQAEAERDRIYERVEALRDEGDEYWAYMTEALGKAVDAWIRYERGDTDEALSLMKEAAELEESMDKHPTTPGEILPVRELYGDLLLREDRAEEAAAAFEASLDRTPNRQYALAGIERASSDQ